MKIDIDLGTLRETQFVIKNVVEAVEEYCEKDDEGDYVVLIGNEKYEHIRTWIKPEVLEQLKEFAKDI